MENLTGIVMHWHSESVKTILKARVPDWWESNPLGVWISVFVAFSLVLYTFYQQNKIDLPHVGIPRGPLRSWRAWLNFILNAHDIMCEGYKKYSPSGKAYVVSSLPRNIVCLTDHDQMEELRLAAGKELSYDAASEEKFKTKQDFGVQLKVSPTFIQKDLTQYLLTMLPEVEDELELALTEVAKVGEEWTRIKVKDFFPMLIARLVSRVNVGVPVCRNKEYLTIALEFTERLVMAVCIADYFPSLLHKGILWWLFKRHRLSDRAINICGPLFDERRRKQRELSDEQWTAVKPRDPIQCMLDGIASTTPAEPLTNESLTKKLLGLNLSSIHTMLLSVVHLLYDIISHPEYIDPLRVEIITHIDAHGGLTPQAISTMYKLDSCLKESQRLNTICYLGLNKMALKDYTFKSGHSPFTLPKGTIVGVPTHAVHLSQEVYGTDSGEWKGFRFSQLREGLDDAHSRKYQAASTSLEYLAFSHGKHACPGRFFAVANIKLIISHLLLNYDIRFPAEQGSKRPQNKYFSGVLIADMSAELEFKRRKR